MDGKPNNLPSNLSCHERLTLNIMCVWCSHMTQSTQKSLQCWTTDYNIWLNILLNWNFAKQNKDFNCSGLHGQSQMLILSLGYWAVVHSQNSQNVNSNCGSHLQWCCWGWTVWIHYCLASLLALKYPPCRGKSLIHLGFHGQSKMYSRSVTKQQWSTPSDLDSVDRWLAQELKCLII